MILSGREIEKQVNEGNIYIKDFDKKRLNPNSYNLRLGRKLLVYDNQYFDYSEKKLRTSPLDMKRENPFHLIEIPSSGFTLRPDTLYLGQTMEYTETDKFVPMLEGRSSVGRLGVFVHVTAGFGDVGFKGYWTLEIHCVQPVIIYPEVEICQIYYHTLLGSYDRYDSGKYQNNFGVQPSMMYKDFAKE